MIISTTPLTEINTEKIVSSAVVTPAVIVSKPLKSVKAVSTKTVFVRVAATAAIPKEIGFLSFVFESVTKTAAATIPTIILGTNEIIGFWNGILPGIGS